MNIVISIRDLLESANHLEPSAYHQRVLISLLLSPLENLKCHTGVLCSYIHSVILQFHPHNQEQLVAKSIMFLAFDLFIHHFSSLFGLGLLLIVF